MPRDTSDTRDANAWVLVFTDESDRSWEVREIRDPYPSDRRNRFLRSEYTAGWLLFVSGDERRRFAPYPPGWRFADAARLRCWVADALPVRATGASLTALELPESPPASRSSQETA
jgi:hypothetical protein